MSIVSVQHRRASAGTGGFTLIEMMIAVLIAGILAMIAVPAYQESVRKSRRSEAFTALAAVQQAQERWRGGHVAYTTDLADLGNAETTPSGYYTIALAAPSDGDNALASGYIATATAVSGTSQAADAQCAKLGVRMLAGNLAYAGSGIDGTLSYAETNACWAR